MRGVKSFAMVLCVRCSISWVKITLIVSPSQATSKDGKEAGIELVQPPAGSKPGDRVYFDGPAYQGIPHLRREKSWAHVLRRSYASVTT